MSKVIAFHKSSANVKTGSKSNVFKVYGTGQFYFLFFLELDLALNFCPRLQAKEVNIYNHRQMFVRVRNIQVNFTKLQRKQIFLILILLNRCG